MPEKTLPHPFDEDAPENNQELCEEMKSAKALEESFLELLDEVRTYDTDKRKRNLYACAYHLAEPNYDIKADVEDYLSSQEIEQPSKDDIYDAIYSGVFQEPFERKELSAEAREIHRRLSHGKRLTDKTLLPLLHKETRKKALSKLANVK